VSGRVQRRQAERYTDRDAQIAADRQQAYQQQAPSAPPPQAATGDTVQQLKDLAELKNQGVLTEEEFAAQKAKVLAG